MLVESFLYVPFKSLTLCQLAKEHHPDLNPQSNNQMSEIVAAYEAVMAPTSNVGGDSRVAIACEVMTLEELRRGHYVYTVQVLYEQNLEKETEETMVLDESIQTELSNSIIYKLVLHADDSVSDFKQSLQRHYGKEWGLDQRRSDRHGLAMGWELVTSGKNELQVLGNHWFLYTYQVAHGDLVHAIVRKNDKE